MSMFFLFFLMSPKSLQFYHCENGFGQVKPSKINMEPENDSSEDDFPSQLGDF